MAQSYEMTRNSSGDEIANVNFVYTYTWPTIKYNRQVTGS